MHPTRASLLIVALAACTLVSPVASSPAAGMAIRASYSQSCNARIAAIMHQARRLRKAPAKHVHRELRSRKHTTGVVRRANLARRRTSIRRQLKRALACRSHPIVKPISASPLTTEVAGALLATLGGPSPPESPRPLENKSTNTAPAASKSNSPPVGEERGSDLPQPDPTETAESAEPTPTAPSEEVSSSKLHSPELNETPGTPPSQSPAPATAALSIAVSGNHLVDAQKQIVTLHGVNISGTQWECLSGKAFATPNDEAAISAIAAWHVNAVRIPLNEDCWLGINGAPTDVATYHQEIWDYVQRLHAQGMYAILDLHWNAPGATLSHLGPGFEAYFETADEDHTPTFWESVSTYFKEDHAVLFDLVNEPFGISWRCWLEGCMAPRGFQTAGMQQLVDAIRNTGATQPIMVGGLEDASLAGQEWLNYHPIDPDSQLVASVHAYDQKWISVFNKNIGVVAEQFPVVMGEIGEKDCADDDLDVLLPWADEHGVSYLAWDWYTGGCTTSPALISDYNGTPTNYGIGYREHLLATFPAPSP
jgi:endoglucanase